MPRFRLGLKRGLRPQLFAVLAGLAVVGAGSAHAQQPPVYSCGDIPNPNSVPKIQPTFRTNAGLNNGEFDCMAWQDFVYFMWPAQPGQRGAPKPSPARLGDAGPTVWETYRTVDTVFLPNAQNPGPWNQPQLMATLRASLAQQVSSGVVRHLTMTSKVSRAVLANPAQRRHDAGQYSRRNCASRRRHALRSQRQSGLLRSRDERGAVRLHRSEQPL